MKGYGLANVELGVPATHRTIYKLGSLSKPFVASAVMLLVKDGKIDLDERIKSYFKGIPSAWSEVAVRHLLAHTSGIARDPPSFDPYKIQTTFEMIESAFSVPLLFRPGDAWAYSNLGYFVLAEIILRVTGSRLGDFVRETVFQPTGMGSTRTTSVSDLIESRANSYFQKGGRMHNAGDLLAMRPSSAFVSNVSDLAKWETALRRGRILNREIQKQMETPASLRQGGKCPYGLGWRIAHVNGHRLVRHGGGLWCFRTEFARYIDDGLTVILLCNHRDANAALLAFEVACLYEPDLADKTVDLRPDHWPDDECGE